MLLKNRISLLSPCVPLCSELPFYLAYIWTIVLTSTHPSDPGYKILWSSLGCLELQVLPTPRIVCRQQLCWSWQELSYPPIPEVQAGHPRGIFKLCWLPSWAWQSSSSFPGHDLEYLGLFLRSSSKAFIKSKQRHVAILRRKYKSYLGLSRQRGWWGCQEWNEGHHCSLPRPGLPCPPSLAPSAS